MTLKARLILHATALAAIIASCGGDRDPSTAGSTSGGQEGSGGGGGGASSTAALSTSAASSAASLGSSSAETSSSGGAGGNAAPNGCDALDFEPLPDDHVVLSNGTSYVPRCFEVAAGSAVRFVDDFATHPLVGGLVFDGETSPDPQSPIPEARTGDEMTVVFDEPGDFGFYCENHATLDMMGVARVR
jgi:plastocyanin